MIDRSDGLVGGRFVRYEEIRGVGGSSMRGEPAREGQTCARPPELPDSDVPKWPMLAAGPNESEL